MEEKYLYVVFSSTPNRLGGFIRRVTGAVYNHASISLDPKLQTMYGFARRYYRTPFYGGFVLETPARYQVKGVNSRVEVYRVPISPENYCALKNRLEDMYRSKEQYLYNHFSAWLFPLGWRIPAKDAYICVEFCIETLQMANVAFDPKKHYKIDDLRTVLMSYKFYQGEMPQNGSADEVYFSKKPLPHPIYSSLCSIAALLPRIGQK